MKQTTKQAPASFPLRPIRTVVPRFLTTIRQRWLLTKRIRPLADQGETTPDIVVSLTSYPERFPTLPVVLRSLLFQSVRPKTIIVWLDCRPQDLPADLWSFSRYGIQFRFVKPGLRSHNKWFHAFREFGDSLVITVDDDIAYPFRMVESLFKAHNAYPDAVCALRGHSITLTPDGRIAPYNNWTHFKPKHVKSGCPSHSLLATGCWGVLYPCHVFDGNPHAFNEELIIRHSLFADDIWLKFMELVSDRKVYLQPSSFQMFPMAESQMRALAETNCFSDASGITGNDKAILSLAEFFKNDPRCSKFFPICPEASNELSC